MANDMVLRHEEVVQEKEHKRKGTKISFGIHLTLLVLAFFVKCNHEKVADNQYAVAINFEEIIPPEPEKLLDFSESSNSNKAQSTEGEARKDADKPAEIAELEQKVLETTKPPVELPKPIPTPTPPTPTEPVISETVVEEEAEVTAVEEVMEIEEPELEPVPDPIPAREPMKEPDPTPPKAKKSTRDRLSDLLNKIPKSGGTKTDDKPSGEPSRSGGTDGTGEGSKGTGKGSDASGNDGDSGIGTGGAGKGAYDGSGQGVFGRKVIHRNFKDILAVNFENQEGKKIVAKICINQSGHVVYAELLEFETTAIIPAGKEKQVLKGFYGYKYENDRSAPQEQCGKLTFLIENINAFGF